MKKLLEKDKKIRKELKNFDIGNDNE